MLEALLKVMLPSRVVAFQMIVAQIGKKFEFTLAEVAPEVAAQSEGNATNAHDYHPNSREESA